MAAGICLKFDNFLVAVGGVRWQICDALIESSDKQTNAQTQKLKPTRRCFVLFKGFPCWQS